MSRADQRRVPPYYDRNFVEREMSVEAIDEQAKLLLYRALNIGRAIGFIGSGLSSAYGRPTWSKLIDDLQRHAERLSAKREGLSKDEQKRLKDLREIASKVSAAAPPGVSDPDVLPLKAQLYRKIAAEGGDEDPEVEDPAQRFVKRVTCNDDYTAFSTWSEFYGPKSKKRNLDLETLAIDKDWRRIDTIETIATALAAAAEMSDAAGRKSEWTRLTEVFAGRRSQAAATGEMTKAGKGLRASVEERFLVPLVLAELSKKERLKTIRSLRKAAKDLREVEAEKPDPGENADARRGRSVDPIRILFEDLRIRRVLTTNYDFELEMGLERLGFEDGKLRPNPEVDSWSDTRRRGELISQRPLGDHARSTVFKRETAADLTSFAVRAHASNEFEIFHLHGRALGGVSERLVITERDYQENYLRNSPEAHVMDEALTAAMGGNPVVFLGMGMMEADLLRPLRRFVAGPRAQLNRSIIAVLPTEESLARRAKTALQLYLRYGVHVMYYAGGEADNKQLLEFGKDVGAPWLPAQQKEVDEDDTQSTQENKQDRGDDRTDRALLFLAIDRIRTLGRLLKDDPERLARHMRRKPLHDPFDVVDACLAACAPRGSEECHVRESLKVARALMRDADFARESDRVGHLRDFLGQVEGRVRARALCDVMREISEKRRDWWQKWREQPRVRKYKHLIEERKDGKWELMPNREYQPFLSVDKPEVIRSVRYQVEHRSRDDVKSPEDKTIDSAIKAITTTYSAAGGRRIFIVYGDAGAGRGQFFHRISEEFADNDAQYQWGLFTNATFSTEYSSVIDGVNNFLWRCTWPLSDPPGEKVKSRRDALAFHLGRLYRKGGVGDASRRGLLLIGGAELLFRSKGTAKNLEIVGALSTLLNEEQGRYPLDIVLCCRREKCGVIFGEGFDRPDSNGVAHNLRFGDLPKDVVNPKFEAQLLALEAPDVTARVDARLGGDERIKGALAAAPLPENQQDRNSFVGKLAVRVSDEALKERIAALMSDDWRRAMKSRFGGAIILDCAVETFARANQTDTDGKIDRAVEATVHFLTSLGDLRSRVNDRGGIDLAIAAVLAQYERLERHYPALDPKIRPELCTQLLKHLSIICAPVEISVLLRCPEIETYLKDHAGKNNWLQLLHEHLTWLEHHSLIFKIRSRSEMAKSSDEQAADEKPEDPRFFRFVAHQSLQGYFFHRIGSAHIELGDSRLFTVSVYPTQSTDAPTPSFETYQFLTKLLRQLIAYPTSRWRAAEFANEDERRVAACGLRAGVSLTRSAFSMAVVSRFSEYAAERQERHSGFMEEYRLLLRWMIFQAGMLGINRIEINEKGADANRDTDQRADAVVVTDQGDKERASIHLDRLKDVALDSKKWAKLDRANEDQRRTLYHNSRFNALYQDEVTWLYNECALVSYVQGNILDSLALYDMALASNAMVETKTDNGPNALRIRLNRAICVIDRGSLDRANNELRVIWHLREREPVIAAAARGYMGLVAQLKRRVDQARRYYDQSLKDLREYGESRALSIIQRHYGDMERVYDRKRARQLLSAALAEAETTRQQDLVHRVRVSMARCDLSAGPGKVSDAGIILRRLDEVMKYADVMEIHSLKVDALLARSLGISHQGETRTAGDHAVTALSLSTLYGQNLRAVYAMTRLGALIATRHGYEQQGRRLLASASAMAETYNYQPAREAIGARLADLDDEGAGED